MDHLCNKESEIGRIDEKTDRLVESLIDVKVELTRSSVILETQAKILEDHIKRTEIAEQRLDKLEMPYKIIAFIGVPLGGIWTLVGILAKLNLF